MHQVRSFLQGAWCAGAAPTTPIHDPTTGAQNGEVSSHGLDLAAALDHARTVGGPTLRAMTFAQRGELLGQLSAALHTARDPLIDIARQCMGATRGDAKFDIDGAAGTLAYYANLGKTLGDRTYLLDGDQIRISRSSRFLGQHILVPKTGVAVHINAFNFPAWNLCEKAACALLAGVPVLAKPGTATAWLAEAVVALWVDQGLLPAGTLQLLCGSAGDLLDHVGPQDVIVFTGSSGTARSIRTHPTVVANSVPVNVEADSLNAAVLGPDVEPGSDTWQMFIGDVVKEITQKAGQKCTAVRRIVVPAEREAEVVEALTSRLQDQPVGDPAELRTVVGPLASPAQKRDVERGLAELSQNATLVWRGHDPKQGCFVPPQLWRAEGGAGAAYVHDHEVFGPVATLLPIDGSAAAVVAVGARGGGGLVCSVYSDDRAWCAEVLLGLAPWHGRILWGSAKVFDQGTGHGSVLPSLVHGGPGKAGGGEELGGERGLRHYLQRTAIQGDTQLLRAVFGKIDAAPPA